MVKLCHDCGGADFHFADPVSGTKLTTFHVHEQRGVGYIDFVAIAGDDTLQLELFHRIVCDNKRCGAVYDYMGRQISGVKSKSLE
jgi:hypothetical protein